MKTNVAGVDPALIKVAIWKDSAGAVAMNKLPINYSTIIADKIRPYIYAHNGGTSIDVYHAFTAKKIFTINNVAANVAGMAVSPDGSRLFVLDTANPALAVIDLSTMKLSATWSTKGANSSTMPLLAMRSNDVDFVLLGNGMALRDGLSLGRTGMSAGYYSQAGAMSAMADGSAVYIQDSGMSPASSAVYHITYSAIGGGMLMVKPGSRSSGLGGSNGKDIAISLDGTRLYLASGYPYQCTVADLYTMSKTGSLPGGDAYPNNVEVSNDGRVICGIFGWYSKADFWVYSANGAQLASYKIAGYGRALQDRQLVMTPDGLIVAALTDDPLLAFVAIGL
ncbi:hypothetical protein HA050_17300 [Iodobacter sp. HSC-16F04]|uniref:Uncharacterized protein n=1 Tax=Iodobacter violaceini TaxID=3044271 RepID=A0ABX0KZ34_9NEIS|nr:hypothetical protein [Iodobacter violacea]NHQ87868.1 hypothetical protein [Iodobacter violacea]